MEREAGGVGQRAADRVPASVQPAGGANGAGGVLDQGDAVRSGVRTDRGEIAGQPHLVGAQDRPGAGADQRWDRRRIEIERFRQDIGEHRARPAHVNRIRGGDEAVAEGDYLIPGADTHGEQRQM
jgi:hypothetical protein